MASEFTSFMRDKLLQKGITQQQVFRFADISEKFGYKLISGEKHTRQRDLIIKLCLAAQFTEEELSTALQLYGMSPLFSQNSRDEVIRQALKEGVREIADLNEALEKAGFERFYESKRGA